MHCPFATWRGSPNVGGNLIRPAKGLVVHVEVGTETGTNSCFQNPRFQASAHFGCANDGSLDQWVDTDAVAWAEVAGNPGWISVETEGDPSTPLTQAQVASIGRLFQWLRGLYGFPSQTCDHDGTGLTTHAHYPSGIADASWGGHPCPGTLRSAQLPAILAAASPQEEPIMATDTDRGGWVRLAYLSIFHREPTPGEWALGKLTLAQSNDLDAFVASLADSAAGRAAEQQVPNG